MICPNCGSYETQSNKIDSATLVRAAMNCVPGLGASAGVCCWAAVHMANSYRRDWLCTNCGCKF